jgi:hypothetical protein
MFAAPPSVSTSFGSVLAAVSLYNALAQPEILESNANILVYKEFGHKYLRIATNKAPTAYAQILNWGWWWSFTTHK